MKSSAYWKKRFEALEDENYRKSEAYYKDLQEQFRIAQNSISLDIEHWYQRIADNNEISLAAAKRLLKKDELEEFHWNVQQYIKKGEENAVNQKWMKQLENVSAKYHISYLESMKLQIQQHCELLSAQYHGGLTEFLHKSYEDRFYHSAFEIRKGVGVGWNLAKLDTNKIDKIITTPWAADGKNFSERIWTNKEKLVKELHTQLSQSLIRGEDPQKAINSLAKTMNVSKSSAGRLIMTESAAISSMSQKDCFKELDVEEFEFIATLDSLTLELCRSMDGRHFKMSDYEVGVNAPPLHCRCRSCVAPYFDDKFDIGERAARGEDGKIYYVPTATKYSEWKKAFVDGEIKEKFSSVDMSSVQEYRPINRSADSSSEVRGTKELIIRKIDNSVYAGKIYISDSVKLKPKQMYNIEKSINDALKKVGSDGSVPRCVIISSEEMQTGALCSYNAVKNTMYLNSVVADTKKLLELQRNMACPNNPLSTYVHEFIHWKDAQEYRKTSQITNQKEYLKDLRTRCKKKLDRLEKQGYNVLGVSQYAKDEYMKEKYDETWTEYRVEQLLQRRE